MIKIAYGNYVCENCGANLDPGEHCTCEQEAEENRRLADRLYSLSKKSNQMSFSFQEVQNEKTVAC